MENYFVVLIIVETILVFVLIGILFYKSKQLSKLVDAISKLQKDEKEETQLQKQRDDFLAMLVHELRSPLSVIKGASDLIMREASNLSKDQIETLLSQIKSSSTGLLNIVNDILDISKMESGKFTVDKTPSDINKMLKDECDYYYALAQEKKIDLTYSLDNNIHIFSFDSERIKQVMNNLLSNAIKFSAEGGTIVVRSNKTNEHIEVSVSDSGVGIPDDMKPKLFHKFVQLGNDNIAKSKGTGLGLVVAKGIIEAHGGKIWVEDNKPKGARFLFSLPL